MGSHHLRCLHLLMRRLALATSVFVACALPGTGFAQEYSLSRGQQYRVAYACPQAQCTYSPWRNSPEAAVMDLCAWFYGRQNCRNPVVPDNLQRATVERYWTFSWAKYWRVEQINHAIITRPNADCPAGAYVLTSDDSCSLTPPACPAGQWRDGDSGTCQAASPTLTAKARTGTPTDPNCSNPINGVGGNKYQHEIDLRATAESPLPFERHYNSVVSLSRSLSRGWRHTYDRMVIAVEPELGSSAYAFRPDGRIAAFVRTASGWEPQAHVLDRLVDVMVDGQRQWQLLNHQDNSTEVYNARGYLLAIVHANGRRLTLAYDHLDRIVSVTDVLSGRRLSFTHTGPTSHRIATLTTPDGGVIRYGYSEAAGFPQLTTVTYPGSTTVSRQYRYNEPEQTGGANLPNALTGILDGAGTRIARYAYDAQGRGILSEHAGGVNRHTLAYNSDGSTTVTDALGTARVYRYTDINGRLRQTSVSQPPGAGCGAASASRTYDAFGNITRSTDFQGVVTAMAWEGLRALNTETIEGAGSENPRTTRTQWHPHWRLPLRMSKTGQRFTYRYHGDAASGGLACAPAAAVVPDGLGSRPAPLLCELSVQATDDASGAFGFAAPLSGASQTWRFSWGGAGQLLGVVGPGGATSTATYAANGDLSSTTNPAGHTTQILSRDGAGRPLSVREANGGLVTLAWTRRGELLSRSVAGFTTTYGRDASDRLTSVQLPDGSRTSLSYDLAGRLTGITQPDGSSIRFTLDLMGRTIQTDWLQANGSLSRSERSSFDALGREQSRTVRRNGREYTSRFEYDANGNLHTLTDPKQQTTRFAHDALGRLSQITDPLSGLTRFTHDGLDQLTGLQAPNNATTRFSIDGLGRVHLEDSPDRGTRQAAFDAAGNLTRLTDARGIVENRAYDALNRLTQVAWPGSSTAIRFTWDSAEGCSLGIGRICAVADAERGVRYAYDARGNRISETRIDQQGITYTTTYTYDAADRLVQIGYPSGLVIGFERNAAGLIRRVTGTRPGQGTFIIAEDIQTDALGRIVSYRQGNGAVITRRHHEDGLFVGQDVNIAGGPASSLTLDHDASSNAGIRVRDGSTSYFAFDLLNRVDRELGPLSQGFDYDANGNRLNDGRGSLSYQPNSNRLSTAHGQAVILDEAGHTLQARGLNFQWNHAGQLQSASRAGAMLATYAYDHRWLRVRKTTSAGTTHYHHDQEGHLIAETTGNGQASKSYVWLGDLPLAVIEHGQPGERILYLEADHLNSPIAARDQSGKAVWRWESDAFGSVQPNEDPDADGHQTVINLRFPGQYYDAETGLHQNWHRTYDPLTGRYISSDPIGVVGGPNSYGYTEGNPLSRIDPRGLASLVFQLGGAYVPGLGGEGNLGVFINGYKGRLDIGLYTQGGLSAGYQIPGVSAQAGWVKGDINTIRGITRNLNIAAPIACGTMMTDESQNLLGMTFGAGSKLGGSLTYSDTGVWSLSEALGRLFDRVLVGH